MATHATRPDCCTTSGSLRCCGPIQISTTGFWHGKRLATWTCSSSKRRSSTIDPCEAGAWILEQWEFPKELRQVASLHHPETGERRIGLLPVVYAGWRMADLLGFSV